MIEAMASGVPVVAAEVGGMRAWLTIETRCCTGLNRRSRAARAAARARRHGPARLAGAALQTVRAQFDEDALPDRYAALIASTAATR